MGILSWVVMGLVAGLVARWIMPGSDPMGWIMTIVLGIAGAFLGGWIGSQLGWGGLDGFHWQTFFLAVGGACLILFLYHLYQRRQ